MGQIKNIKLHIVTDIKSTKWRRELKRLVNATTNHTHCVYVVVARRTTSRRKHVHHVATQVLGTEVSTGVPKLREERQLEKYERLQGRHLRQVTEEICCTIGCIC